MRNAVQSLWAEPRAPDPPLRIWRDWALVAVLVPTAVIEGTLREDLVWRPAAIVVSVATVFTLLWRRTHPLVVVAVAFGASVVLTAATLIASGTVAGLYTMAFVLLLPYSLFRWGAGREIVVGLTIMLETGDIHRFAAAGNFASYCRCVDATRTSNGKTKGSGNAKAGNKYLSWAYSEAAHFAVRFEPLAQRFYERKKAKTNGIIAIRAVARKLARATWMMLKHQVPYDARLMFPH